MADLKISQLGLATTPLSGAEETAIVQGGVTKKTTVNEFLSNFTAALNLKEDKANKGIADGYAPLNGSGLIDSTYLPSYVDDVIEVADFASLPVTGETGKIYVTLDDNKIYRWSGSIYVEIGNPGNFWNLTGNAGTDPATNFIGTTDAVDFRIRVNNLERFSFTTAGNLGINTTTPSQKLDINGNVRIRQGLHDSSNTRGVNGQILKTTGTQIQWSNLTSADVGLNNVTNTEQWSLLGNAGTSPATNFIGTTDAQDFVIKTNNVERIRISENDAVNINSNTNIISSSGNTNLFMIQFNPSINTGVRISMNRYNGTQLSPSGLLNNQPIGSVGMGGYNGTTLRQNSASISSFTTENWSNTANGCYLSFQTTSNGTTTAVRRLYIEHDGKIAVGNITPTKTLDVDGEVRIRTLPTGLSTENILVANANGDVRAISPSTFVNTNTWGLLGNSGTNSTTNFIGTTDSVDFVIRAGNVNRAIFRTTGVHQIGTNAIADSGVVINGYGTGDRNSTLQFAASGLPLAVLSAEITRISSTNGELRVVNYGTGSFTINTNGLNRRITVLSGGNVGIGTTAPTSRLQVTGLPTYADNAAAVSGGLTAGALYIRTGHGLDIVV